MVRYGPVGVGRAHAWGYPYAGPFPVAPYPGYGGWGYGPYPGYGDFAGAVIGTTLGLSLASALASPYY